MRMSKTLNILFIAFAFAVLMLTGCTSNKMQPNPAYSGENSADNQAQAESESQWKDLEENGIPALEVSKHNQVNDCWIIYSGDAYDVTEFLSKRSERTSSAYSYCGTTDDFERELRSNTESGDVKLFEALAVKKGPVTN